MISISIPDFGLLELHHLVMDFNGTLALDGRLLDGIQDRFETLCPHLTLHVVTADTFGNAADQLKKLPCQLNILPPDNQPEAKASLVHQLGHQHVAAIGNGRNDQLMLQAAVLGIALTQQEGGAVKTIMASDIVCTSISDALDLLLNPKRLIATLRS